jgi:tetratricopeptide (TPR) repeat protein
VKSYSELRIAPFTGLLNSASGGVDHQGGPDFPDWSGEVASRHCRYGNRPMDIQPKPPVSDPRYFVGDFAYLGPICHHFGHQIGDFSMRIMPTKLAGFDGRFVFGGKQSLSPSIENAPRFVREIVDYFDLPRRQIRIVNEDAILEHVRIASQAETIFGPPPDHGYLLALADHFAARREKRSSDISKAHRIVYISRSQLSRGIFAGETAIERLMRSAGAHIVYPENEQLEDLLEEYASAEYIVGAEGSAFHAMQLLGKQLANVVVIKRGNDARNFGYTFLMPRCKSLAYVDAVTGGISGKLDGRYREAGLSAVCFDRLREGLKSALPIDVSDWKPSDFQDGVFESFERWISDFWYRQPDVPKDAVEIMMTEAEQARIPLSPQALTIAQARFSPPSSHFVRSALHDDERSHSPVAGIRLRCALLLAEQRDPQGEAIAVEMMDNDRDCNLSSELLGEIAITFWRLGSYEISRRATAMAITKTPDRFWLWLHKAHVDRKLGDVAAAEEAAERASIIDPGRAEIHHLLAIMAAERAEPELALRRIDKAIQLSAKPAFAAFRESVLKRLDSAKPPQA